MTQHIAAIEGVGYPDVAAFEKSRFKVLHFCDSLVQLSLVFVNKFQEFAVFHELVVFFALHLRSTHNSIFQRRHLVAKSKTVQLSRYRYGD